MAPASTGRLTIIISTRPYYVAREHTSEVRVQHLAYIKTEPNYRIRELWGIRGEQTLTDGLLSCSLLAWALYVTGNCRRLLAKTLFDFASSCADERETVEATNGWRVCDGCVGAVGVKEGPLKLVMRGVENPTENEHFLKKHLCDFGADFLEAGWTRTKSDRLWPGSCRSITHCTGTVVLHCGCVNVAHTRTPDCFWLVASRPPSSLFLWPCTHLPRDSAFSPSSPSSRSGFKLYYFPLVDFAPWGVSRKEPFHRCVFQNEQKTGSAGSHRGNINILDPRSAAKFDFVIGKNCNCELRIQSSISAQRWHLEHLMKIFLMHSWAPHLFIGSPPRAHQLFINAQCLESNTRLGHYGCQSALPDVRRCQRVKDASASIDLCGAGGAVGFSIFTVLVQVHLKITRFHPALSSGVRCLRCGKCFLAKTPVQITTAPGTGDVISLFSTSARRCGAVCRARCCRSKCQGWILFEP